MNRLLHPPSRILEVYIKALTGFGTYTVQMVSVTHSFLKTVSLMMTTTMRTVN